ncbi:MAG TPA: ABC transporter ATP-binding protein [Terriglobia bacterium]|nr:ABC transporter ATP-binding protein [Terriglobia bacterium]
MLELRNVSSGYGAIRALKDVNLRIDRGEIVTLIGANGAGKSTTLRNISGLVPITSGEIVYEGKTLNGTPAHRIAAMGIAMAPEGRAIFANLTVLENLEMGAYLQTDRAINAQTLERVYSLFPRLKERRKQLGGTLSGGEQQMLAMGRAMMARPRLLLLDEPSLGLAPIIVHTIFAAIDEINKEGTTILLVEQNANAALKHSNRAYVLETGEIVMEGLSSAIAEDPRVREAYLGER